MNESTRTARKRKRHIKTATQINKQHADDLKCESTARHARARVQIVSEVLDNRQIDYKSHMMWLRR